MKINLDPIGKTTLEHYSIDLVLLLSDLLLIHGNAKNHPFSSKQCLSDREKSCLAYIKRYIPLQTEIPMLIETQYFDYPYFTSLLPCDARTKYYFKEMVTHSFLAYHAVQFKSKSICMTDI